MELQKTSLYSSDAPDNSEAKLKETGFDLNIPQKQNVDFNLPNHEENIVDNIVKQATTNKDEEQKVLGELETMSSEMANLELPVAPEVENNSKLAKTVFVIVVVISLTILAYYTAVAKNLLGYVGLQKVTVNLLTESEKTLNDIKSQSIASDYLSSSLAITNLSYFTAKLASDDKLLKSAYTTQQERQAKENEIKTLKLDIQKNLKIIKNNLATKVKDLTPEATTSLEAYITKNLQTVATQIQSVKNDQEMKSLKSKKALLEDAQRLVKNTDIIQMITQEDFTKMDTNQLLNFLKKLLDQSKLNYMSKIAVKQASKILPTQIMAELDKITQQQDPTGNMIKYSNYNFNAGGDIVVSGNVHTQTQKTFTFISDLNQAIEDSPMFSNAGIDTFAKTEETSENGAVTGFTSTLSLNFHIEQT